jgi:hypothetical protein
MELLLELLRPHGWLALIAMLLVNIALCNRFGGRALFVTIPVVGIVYGMLDAAWIRSEMARPDWDGQPDQDAIFMIGAILRVATAAILLFASYVATLLLSNAIHARQRYSQTKGGEQQSKAP